MTKEKLTRSEKMEILKDYVIDDCCCAWDFFMENFHALDDVDRGRWARRMEAARGSDEVRALVHEII